MENNNNEDEQLIYKERNKTYYPIGITVSDAREAIKGVAGFRESIREDTIVFNYDSISDESFPDPNTESDQKKSFLLKVRRECRGLIFDKSSEQLICRKLHKFFNIGESKECKAENIDLSSEPYILMDKIDGSLIAPMLIKDGTEVYFGSKQGVSELGSTLNQYVESFNDTDIKYKQFSMEWLSKGCTPLFEYSSSKQQIILFYNQESLKLLAIRNNHTGEYIKWSELVESCTKYNIPHVDKIDTTSESSPFASCKSTNDLVNAITQLKLVEGCVLKFENSGKMYKIKTQWYVILARLSLRSPKVVRFEKDVFAILLSGHYDDVKNTISMLTCPNQEPSDKIKSIEQFSKVLFDRIDYVAEGIIKTIIAAKKENHTRKTFHTFPPQNITNQAKVFSYNFFDQIDSTHTVQDHISQVSKELIKRLKDCTNSNNKIEGARQLLGHDIRFEQL